MQSFSMIFKFSNLFLIDLQILISRFNERSLTLPSNVRNFMKTKRRVIREIEIEKYYTVVY